MPADTNVAATESVTLVGDSIRSYFRTESAMLPAWKQAQGEVGWIVMDMTARGG